ncbi:MAG: glycosyltransferase [Muribaculaceae bacterium]|nr:glycosyltransferase [Muribaculaceae bacterium]
MSKPLVSVIIPVYNVEPFLAQCLDSVCHQTYENLEIICVNDGSTDRCAEILNEWATLDERINVITIANSGLSNARNVGTQACSGQYLMYLDSDDWIDTSTVQTAVLALEDADAELALWNYVKEYRDTSARVEVFKSNHIYRDEDFKLLHRRLIGLVGSELRHPELCDSMVTAWGKLYVAQIIKHNNITFTDTRLIGTEDLLFNAAYFNHIASAVIMHQHFNHYRKYNAASLTSNYKPNLFTQWTEMQRQLRLIIEGRDYLNEAYYNRIALSIIGLGLNAINSPESTGKQCEILKSILTTSRYKEAYRRLSLYYFPVHWKMFFFCAKHRLACPLLMLLKIIHKIINR